MAYTSPTTRSTGNAITAAIWNADMVDDIKWLAGDSGGKPSCRVYHSGNFAITTATLTELTYDSERWDSGGMHSTVSNTGRITVPSGGAGKYLIGGSIQFASNATGVRYLEILVNGTTNICSNGNAAVSAAVCLLDVSTVYSLAVGDYCQLFVYQTSGGNLLVEAAGNYSAEFYAIWQAL